MWEQKLIESKVFRAQDFPVTAIREYSTTAGFFYPASSGIRPVYGTSAASMPMGPAYSVGDMAQYPAVGMVPLAGTVDKTLILACTTGSYSPPTTAPEHTTIRAPARAHRQRSPRYP